MDPTQAPILAAQNRAIPQPQTGALTADQDASGVDSLAAQPSLAPTIARNTIVAGQQNHGDSRDWAENAVAGVTAALAGFGSDEATKAYGGGPLEGIGNAASKIQGRQDQLRENAQKQAQLKTENAQRQQQIDLEKQKVQNEQGQFDKDYQLKLAENARQQANQVKEFALNDANLRRLSDEHDAASTAAMRDTIKFMQSQTEYLAALKEHGGHPLQFGGKAFPEFDDDGQLEKFIMDNHITDDLHTKGYVQRPVVLPSGKHTLYEQPDSGVEMRTLTDADGKKFETPIDILGAANYAKSQQEIRESRGRTAEDYARAQADAENYKASGTVREAQAKLGKVGLAGLNDGERAALWKDAIKTYTDANTAYEGALTRLKSDPDYSTIPINAQGQVDTTSQQFKDLAEKYRLDQSRQLVDIANDKALDLIPPGYVKRKTDEPGTVGNPSTVELTPQFKQITGALESLAPDARQHAIDTSSATPELKAALYKHYGIKPPANLDLRVTVDRPTSQPAGGGVAAF